MLLTCRYSERPADLTLTPDKKVVAPDGFSKKTGDRFTINYQAAKEGGQVDDQRSVAFDWVVKP